NRKKRLNTNIKKLRGNEKELDLPLDVRERISNIEYEISAIDSYKELYDSSIFELTGKKRLNKELQERFAFYPCVKTVFTNGGFKRENSVPYMKAWIDFPDGCYGSGQFNLWINSEMFTIDLLALDEPSICDIKSSKSGKRNYLISSGVYHRDS
ncbi:hypothetical protein QTO02_10075, partial [Vibrio fortis]